MRILFISPSNPNSVTESRAAGHEAYGCGCGTGEWNYQSDFLNIHFPTDWFDTVHARAAEIPDETWLKELLRVLKQQSGCTLNLVFKKPPSDAKKVHISLEKTLTDIGFGVVGSEWVSSSELTFQLVKPRQNRVKILLPPGMGDIYWALVKMESFLQKNSLGIADAYVVTDLDKVYASHDRAFEFIEMFPFLSCAAITITNGVDPSRREICREAYHDDARSIFKDVMGCDYFFGFNGPLHAGRTLEEIHPEFSCNWFPDMFVSLDQEKFLAESRAKYGRYAVFYFPCVGDFALWVKQFSVAEIIESVRQISSQAGLTPIFAGAHWDKVRDPLFNRIVDATVGAIDLRGCTTVQQLFGLLKGSDLVLGMPSGLTIMAAALKKNVITLWNDYFHHGHWWNVVSRNLHNKTYFAIGTEGLTSGALLEKAKEVIGGGGAPSDSSTLKCICGHEKTDQVDMPACKVQDSGARTPSGKVIFGRCQKCGVVRQINMPFSSKQEFVDFYRNDYPPNKASYEAKDYGHDLNLARKRADAYGVVSEKRILDVGSGSGAFVDECRTRGNEAFGCEIGRYSYEKDDQYIYRQPFEDIHFPTDYFDLVTSHDVLEHALDPVAMIAEAFRVTKQGGSYILDFPRFFDKAGSHHWKDAEHIWLFTTDQLKELLEKTGFTISKTEHPIESKTVFHCAKPKQHRVKILLPPGIGDCYWPIVKLQAFIKRENLGIPDLLIAAPEDRKFKSHLRAMPFLEMFPFANASWETIGFGANDLWKEAYTKAGRTIFKDVLGCDYFMSYNGILEAGLSMAQVDTDLECDWYPPRFVSLEEQQFMDGCIREHGRYLVLAFYFHGTFTYWSREFGPEKIIESIRQISKDTGLKPVFAGGAWDAEDKALRKLMSTIDHVDLVGKTTVPQMFGLIRGSELVIGYPSGFTMSATLLKKKTIALWNDYHRYGFYWNTSPPDSKNKFYFIENTKGLTPNGLSSIATDAVHDKGNLAARSYADRIYCHELEVAREKIKYCSIQPHEKVLQVGCGSGALVDECRDLGVEAFGCEEMEHDGRKNDRHIYKDLLTNIHFPTDHFDKVVVGDTFGHLMDPVRHLEEVFRIVKQGGQCFLTLAKNKAMNVWWSDPPSMERLLKKTGFSVKKIDKFNEGLETIFCLSKPAQKRTSILLPPGIGDSYWSMVKLQSFIQEHKISSPVDIYIASPKEKKEVHLRAMPFIDMFPFLHSTDQVIDGRQYNELRQVWQEAYFEQKRSIFKGIAGCDYFISWNGYLRAGQSLRDVDPDYECNWLMPRFISLKEELCRKDAISSYGDYFIAYFLFRGTNRLLLNHFSQADIVGSITRIARETGCKPIFVGAAWDLDDVILSTIKRQVPGAIDLVGKTDIMELFGLMRGSKGFVGIPSGLAIVTPLLGVRSSILWSQFFTTKGVNRDFAMNTFPPSSLGKTYFPMYAEDTTPADFAARSISVIRQEPIVEGKQCPRKPRDKGIIHTEIAAVDFTEPYQSPVRSLSTLRPTTIACVLKTGGDFDERYVVNLKRALDRNLTHPFKFVCLTDLPGIKGVETIRLVNGHPGWWAKIELFRPGLVDTERVLYFDLDTVILANIDDILTLGDDFYGLRPWNKKNLTAGNCASGILAWKNGAYDFLFKEFSSDEINRLGDQVYISTALKSHGGVFTPFQDAIPGIYSYKRECRNGRPQDARIICFHGRPRVHEVTDAWVKEVWR